MQSLAASVIRRWVGLALAVLLPAVLIAALPGLSARGAALLACLGLAGVAAVLGHWGYGLQRAEQAAEERARPVLAQARSANHRLDQLQRRISDLQPLPKELELIKSLINGERHNLSLVAGGVAEARENIEDQRANLGKVAIALHELREAEVARNQATSVAVAKVEEFDDMMEAAHVHLTTLSERLEGVGAKLDRESANLGLVAGGVDAVRRSVIGVEALNTRFAALSDGLVMVADRVDALTGLQRDGGPAMSPEDQTASSRV